QGLRQFRFLNGDWLRADELTNASGRRRVDTPLHALEVGRGVDGLVGVNALGRPSDRVQQNLVLLVEQLLQGGLLSLIKLVGLVVIRSQERQTVGAEDLRLILEAHQKEFTQLRVASLN